MTANVRNRSQKKYFNDQSKAKEVRKTVEALRRLLGLGKDNTALNPSRRNGQIRLHRVPPPHFLLSRME
jgi:hypothetical protein